MGKALPHKPRLLMVDDSRVMRMAATKMLGEQFEVITAEQGEEAWTLLLRDSRIQLVLTDLAMPVLDGFGLLQRLRSAADPALAALPVVVVTGAENDGEARQRALQLGASDFITKPFNSADLLALVSRHSVARRTGVRPDRDRLTGLLHQDAFLSSLRTALNRLRQAAASADDDVEWSGSSSLSLLRMELVDFRQLFLARGRVGADRLLQFLAARLRQWCPQDLPMARTGLAQFALLLPMDAAGARVWAGRLMEQVASLGPSAGGITLGLAVAVRTADLHPGLTARGLYEEGGRLLEAALQGGQARLITDQDRPRSVSRPAAAREPVTPSASAMISVDQALACLAAGREQDVRAQLPALRRRLAPLLEMMDSEGRR